MSVTNQVEAILSHSRLARNSDKELWLIYAQKAGVNLSYEQMQAIRSLPSFETIRRVRQRLQEKGLYAADPQVNEIRYNKFKQMRFGEDAETVLERRIYDHD